MTLTRIGYTSIVHNYQQTREDVYVEEMVCYLERTITQLTLSNLERVSGYGYTYDDVESEVLWTLWEVMEVFDGSQGSDFLAYFRQRVWWRINDELIEKKGSLADEMYYNALTIQTSEGERGVEQGRGISPNMLPYIDDCLEDVSYFTTYEQILEDFQSQPNPHPHVAKAVERDVEVLVVIFQAVEDNAVGDKEVNARLYAKYPEVGKATIRRRKKMATQRFGQFIKGYT